MTLDRVKADPKDWLASRIFDVRFGSHGIRERFCFFGVCWNALGRFQDHLAQCPANSGALDGVDTLEDGVGDLAFI